jgi:hypothetical protein
MFYCQPRTCVTCGIEFTPLLRSNGAPSQAQTCSQFCKVKLTRKSYTLWTQVEIDLLRTLAETVPPCHIRAKYNLIASKMNFTKRSLKAIQSKCNKLGIVVKPEVQVYNVPYLAKCLGVCHTTVYSWIQENGLKATRKCNAPYRHYYISYKELRAFVRKYPQKFAGVDSLNLFSLIDDKKLADEVTQQYPKRLPTQFRSARIRCVTTGKVYNSIGDLCREHNFSRSTFNWTMKRYGGRFGNFQFERIVNG